jgi:hypothetical protein
MAPNVTEIRRLLHALREPLSAFFVYVELLEGTPLTAEAQGYFKAMHAQMDKGRAALDELDFILENGHSSPNTATARGSD